MFAPRGWFQGRGNRGMYRTISQSGEFDTSWYRAQLRGLERLGDPIWHYLRSGWKQGRDPSPHFDTDFYVSWNKDVRLAGINPFDHFLAYGKNEGRPPVLPLAGWLPTATRALEPIRFYDSVEEEKARVSLVLDENTPNRWPGDVFVLVMCSAWIAHGLGKRLRIVLRDGAPEVPDLSASSLNWPPGLDKPSITRVPAGREYSDIEKQRDEIFVASSWSSAHTLYGLLGGTNLIYAVIDDEADALPRGEARSMAQSALRLEGVSYVVSPALGATLFAKRKKENAVIADSSAFSAYAYVNASLASALGTAILLWAGPDTNSSYSRLALQSIEVALQQKAFDPAESPVRMVGDVEQRILLLGTHQVEMLRVNTVPELLTILEGARLLIALDGSSGESPVGTFATSLGVPTVMVSESDLTTQGLATRIAGELKGARKHIGRKAVDATEKLAAFSNQIRSTVGSKR